MKLPADYSLRIMRTIPAIRSLQMSRSGSSEIIKMPYVHAYIINHPRVLLQHTLPSRDRKEF